NDWLVLELIEGMSLRTALARQLHPRVKLKIAEQIAGVLVATHASGIVHRDLKPGNVMLTGDHEVKVLDFGLAASAAPKAHDEARDLPPPRAPTGGANAAVAGFELTRTSSSPLPVSGPMTRDDLSRFQTSHGSVMGTLAYMSPEQAPGDPAAPASDMFSFGLIVQELYTGRHPYPLDLDSATLIDRVRRGAVDPPRPAPADLAALITRLTAAPQAAELGS